MHICKLHLLEKKVIVDSCFPQETLHFGMEMRTNLKMDLCIKIKHQIIMNFIIYQCIKMNQNQLIKFNISTKKIIIYYPADVCVDGKQEM